MTGKQISESCLMMKELFEVRLPNTGTVNVPVRRSLRCRRTVLRMKNGTFELVIPAFAGVREEEIADFLRRSSRWMEKILRRQPAAVPEPAPVIPEKIVLPATGEEYILRIGESAPVSWAGAREAEGTTLVISGNTASDDEVLKALRRWLIRKAEASLLPQAGDLAKLYGKQVIRFRTGLQRSIWGKCTAKSEITLNAALLFVPPELVCYVICHEFTHLDEMNHSPRFWAKLEQLYPHAAEARKRLNSRSKNYVPRWVYGTLS